MTPEEKQLLLKDLCARLPYKLKVKWNAAQNPAYIKTVDGEKLSLYREYPSSIGIFVFGSYIDEIQPYLRPMSSMTEEEKVEASEAIEIELKAIQGPVGFTVENAASSAFMIDFYNKHHFDYRGLIPMGLALEAPEGMYQ